MRKKRNNPRETQRINTTRERHGEDFYQKNARNAGRHAKTKFNSQTGKAAADARWAAHREEQARNDN